MELSQLQTSIINAPEPKIVVCASAASGKTRLLTEKVRQILRSGVDPRQIAVITFTNMAAAELKQRLGDDYKDGLFIGTIHALANYMLCVGGVDTSEVLNDEKFDKLFAMIMNHRECVRSLEWVLLDEGQDSDNLQFNFLFQLINPTHFFIAADLKQSIYQWKGSRPELLKELMSKPDVKCYDLNENYRNDNNILTFAKKLIYPTGLVDTSISMTGRAGMATMVPYVPRTVYNYLNGTKFGDWAILTRTNQQLEEFIYFLEKWNMPYDTFKQGDLSKEELSTKMTQDTIKVLTIHSAKGLEWNNVLVRGARYYNNEERNICYVAATRARHQLIWLTR